MKNLSALMIVIISLTVSSLSFAQIFRSSVSLPDNPEITFTSDRPTSYVYPGMRVTLTYRVVPGPRGSAIRSVNIACPSIFNTTYSNSAGTVEITIPENAAVGTRYAYTLTATNSAGITSTRPLVLDVVTPPDLFVQGVYWSVQLDNAGVSSLYFYISNNGDFFTGKLTLTVKVDGVTAPLRLPEVLQEDALVPLIIDNFRLNRGDSAMFWIRGGDIHTVEDHGTFHIFLWTIGRHRIRIQISTDNPYENKSNNIVDAEVNLTSPPTGIWGSYIPSY